MFLEVEARYATALNRAITQDGRTTFVVSALKVNKNVPHAAIARLP